MTKFNIHINLPIIFFYQNLRFYNDAQDFYHPTNNIFSEKNKLATCTNVPVFVILGI